MKTKKRVPLGRKLQEEVVINEFGKKRSLGLLDLPLKYDQYRYHWGHIGPPTRTMTYETIRKVDYPRRIKGVTHQERIENRHSRR